eukprot:219850_1
MSVCILGGTLYCVDRSETLGNFVIPQNLQPDLNFDVCVDGVISDNDDGDSAQSSLEDVNPTPVQYKSFIQRLRSSFVLRNAPNPSIREEVTQQKYELQPKLNFLHVKSGDLIPSMSTYGNIVEDNIEGGMKQTIPILMDNSPFQIMHTTELRQVEYLFNMLKTDVMFICNSGQLVGWVTREILRTFIGQTEAKVSDEYAELFQACRNLFSHKKLS